MKSQRALLAACGGAALLIGATVLPGTVRADGSETLGPPSIAIADGSGVVVAGVGLAVAQPGTINIDVPAGATVEQVLLYWEGQNADSGGDNTIEVNGVEITGQLIGGPTRFFGGAWSSTYRVDITSRGLISAGANSVDVGGLTFTTANNGAGLTVIYDDGTTSEIAIVDGNDLAYWNFESPLDTTVAQTFTFAAADVDRVGALSLFFSSVSGEVSGGTIRPSILRATSGGVVTQANNLLDSNSGGEWDSDNFTVNIPANATSLTIEALSEDAESTSFDPASFAWNAANLSVPVAAPVIPPTTTIPPSGNLPETGSTSSGGLLGAGLIALLGGLALVSVSRRRPSTS